MKKKTTIHKAEALIDVLFPTDIVESRLSSNSYNYESPMPKQLLGVVEEVEGVYDEYLGSEGAIILRGHKDKKKVMPINKTVYSVSINQAEDSGAIKKGDALYVIAIRADDPLVYVAATVIRQEEKWIFDRVRSLYGRAHAIRNYYLYFKDYPRKQEYILHQLKGSTYHYYNAGQDCHFNSKSEQMLKYALTKDTYYFDTQRAIETMFSDSNSTRHKTDHKLKYLSRIVPEYMDRKQVDKEALIKQLDQHIYKMDNAKKLVVDLLVSNERAEKRGFNLLLCGEPGIGKTLFMEAIANARNLPYEIIPLNGMSTPLELEGVDSGYDSADAGRLIKAFAGHGTSEMVIGFDEIDKMNRGTKEGDPMTVLYRMLQGSHEDKFLGCKISTENTIFVATANSLRDVPEPIINRFHAVIEMEEYTLEDRLVIGREFVLPALLDNFKLMPDEMVFPDDNIRFILENYCEDAGARDLQHNIELIIRRCISEGDFSEITQERVREILGPVVKESPALFFNRHKEEYSAPVSKAIRNCLSDAKLQNETAFDGQRRETGTQKLEYLLACRNTKGINLNAFDPVQFSKQLHCNLYGMEKVIKEVTMFFHTASLQGKVLNSNLALSGGFGVGKSTIVRRIAEAMDLPFAKISLNGVFDAKELRGFASSYVGSEPGRIMKGVKSAGSLTSVIQLDEIDKIKPEFAMALLDLLDREFTDSYLDVPIDFTSTIFIATANDWNIVPPVIRDRFISVHIDGYSRKEKEAIVSDYIIPKLEKGYENNNVSIAIDDVARTYLLDTYCTSFGVRDTEKAVQKIVGGMLLEKSGKTDAYVIHISKADVRKHLGEEPVPEGNFPETNPKPGIAKALSVSKGNKGGTFAIETVLVEGEETIEMTGLPKETVTDSVKVAVTGIRKRYPELLRQKHIHVHFGEGSVPKGGPSAGVALFMSIFSAAIDRPLMIHKPYDIAYTGEISLTGGIFAVGGLYEKIQAANDSGCTRVYVPLQNYERLDKKKLSQFKCEIIPVTHIEQVIESVYPDLALMYAGELFQNRRGA